MLSGTALERTIRQAQELEEDFYYSSKSHYSAAGRYEKINFWLGISIAVASAYISAISQIETSAAKEAQVFSPAISVLIAMMASVIAFSKFGELASKHRESGLKFGELRDKIRNFMMHQSLYLESEHIANEKFQELIKNKNDLNSQALHIPHWAYKVAKRDRSKEDFRHGQREEGALVLKRDGIVEASD